MRYVVQFEVQSGMGDDLSEAVTKALLSVGKVSNILVVPMRTYNLSVQIHGPIQANRPANE
jgi:hypothetical protein